MTSPRHTLAIALLAGVLALAGLLFLLDIRLASSQNVMLVAHRAAVDVPADDPFASVWERAGPVAVPLSGQQTTKPLGGGSVREVTARAMHDDQQLYLLVEWKDESEDRSTSGQELYRDSVAVEFPTAAGDEPPFFCMGQVDGHVNIWQWKADWQALVDRGRSPFAPSLYTDDYALEGDALFQNPAEAAGNVSATRQPVTPVENLLAGGFGTLASADTQPVQGAGRWRDGRWRVLFVRELAGDGETAVDLAQTAQTSIAFAVWDGSKGERDGQKSVSTFVGLELSESPLAGPSADATAIVVLAVVLPLLGVFFVALLAWRFRDWLRAPAWTRER